MRCPRCDSSNSDFAVTCFKCGHKFHEEKTYEDFVPDYATAGPLPGSTKEQLQIDFATGKKQKTIGTLFIVIGIVLALIGGVFSIIMMDSGSDSDDSVKKLDSWAESASNGDTIDVKGTINSEEQKMVAAQNVFVYVLEGSKTEVMSTKDVCNKGDYIEFSITQTDLGPQVSQAKISSLQSSNTTMVILFVVILIVGIILIIFGAVRLNKSKRVLKGEIGMISVPAAPPQPPQQAGAQMVTVGTPPQAPPPESTPPPQPGRPPVPGPIPSPGPTPSPPSPGTAQQAPPPQRQPQQPPQSQQRQAPPPQVPPQQPPQPRQPQAPPPQRPPQQPPQPRQPQAPPPPQSPPQQQGQVKRKGQ
jgi:uncharacterized membrane protein YidH (DUF202 family)